VRRDAALSWEVPPQLEVGLQKPAANSSGQHVPDGEQQRPGDDQDAVDPVVAIHHAAFGDVSERHLAAIVVQLLAAEGVQVALTVCHNLVELSSVARCP
jgi:hypothetical protein